MITQREKKLMIIAFMEAVRQERTEQNKDHRHIEAPNGMAIHWAVSNDLKANWEKIEASLWP